MTAVEARSRSDLQRDMRRLGEAARTASRVLGNADSETRTRALTAAAAEIRHRSAEILEANAGDMAAAGGSDLSAALLDRLSLDEGRIAAIADSLDAIAALPDPVGQVIDEWTRPNGLVITRLRVPLGVIGVIYESRPNVTADAGGLCLRSGNAAILRGGSESRLSSAAIADCLRAGLHEAGLPEACVQSVPTTDRAAVGEMLRMEEFIDVIIPRGGKSLIERVRNESRIPVFAHLEGICHVYVDAAADAQMARDIVVNAKLRRTGVCGAAETLLVDRQAAAALLPTIVDDLLAGDCEVRGDEAARAIDGRLVPATAADWDTEYLDAIISVRLVDGVDGAIAHINRHGSNHTDSIVTGDEAVASRFLREVDSGIVLHNASTQFADGGEFGMGAEIGISTGKLHARGPVGAEQLTTWKYCVRGTGQVRPPA